MIYVSQEQFDQVEYLIEQGLQGNHILFEPHEVRRVFLENSQELSDAEAYAVEHHIETLIMESSMEKKRAYLEQLPPDIFDQVVRTYFNIIENNLLENTEVRH